MLESEKKRVRRTPVEIAASFDEQIEKLEGSISALEEKKKASAADFDVKIAAVRDRIKALQEKKEAVLAPKAARRPRKTKKQRIEEIVKKAIKSGRKPEEIADALGVEVE